MMQNKIRNVATAVAFAAALVVSAMAHADQGGSSGNLTGSGSLNLSGYQGSFVGSATSTSTGGTFAASGGINNGSSGQETTLKTNGSASATGSFSPSGVTTNSSFQSDSMSQTFGLATTGPAWATSGGVGGTSGSASASGSFQSVGFGGQGNISLSDTSSGNLNLGNGFGNNGNHFGHN